jgi:hypothetical protein
LAYLCGEWSVSLIEKDDDLAEMIWVSKFGYAKPLRLAWNAYN